MITVNKIASCILSVSMLAAAFPAAAAESNTIYVSTTGDDSAAGNASAPLRTLEEVKNRIADMTGYISVEIMGGKYYIDETLSFTAEDTANKNITFSAHNGEYVEITNAIHLPESEFSLVDDRDILSRMPAEAEGKVYKINLKDQGITDYGSVERVGMHDTNRPSYAMVIEDDKMGELAAWPNHGAFTSISEMFSVPENVWGYRFKLRDAENYRVKEWGTAEEPYVYGYYNYDWADDMLKITSVDTEKSIMLTYGTSVYGMRVGGSVRFINMLEELDIPGEFYIDRTKDIMYYYPRTGLSDIMLSASSKPVLQLNNASGITFSGIAFSGSRGDGAVIENGSSDNLFTGCEFKNIGRKAIVIKAGMRNGISGCHVHDIGKGGISINAGEAYKKELVSCENYIENSLVENFTLIGKRYCAGIELFGIGDTASGNTIRHAAHAAVRFGGNNNIIEKNDIYNVLMDSYDAGAIYSFRSWINGGTVICDNYIHDCHGGVGIYLDDFMSGVTLQRNRIANMPTGVSLHGSSYITAKNNLFINIEKTAISSGKYWAWDAEKYAKNNAAVDELYKNGTLDEELDDILGDNAVLAREVYDLSASGYNMEKWYAEFPYLRTMISDGEAYTPKGNTVMNNLIYSSVASFETVPDKICYDELSKTPEGLDKAEAEASNTEIATDNPPVRNISIGDITLTASDDVNNTFDSETGELISLEDIGCVPSNSSMKQFSLIAPVNGYTEASALDTVFAWEETGDADGYVLEISSDSDFNNILKTCETNMPYYRVYDDIDFSLEDGRKYYWRVTAFSKSSDYNGVNITSAVSEFTTLAIRFSNIKFYGSDGRELTDFMTQTANIAEFDIENFSNDKALTIQAEAFNGDGTRASQSAAVSVDIKSLQKKSVGLGITASPDTAYIKIYADDGDDSVLPNIIIDYDSIKKEKPNGSFSYKAIHFTDDSGNVIMKPSYGADNLNICIRNITDKEMPLITIAAVYDSDNVLQSSHVKKYDLKPEGVADAYFELEIPHKENSYVRVFLWDYMTCAPLDGIIEFK